MTLTAPEGAEAACYIGVDVGTGSARAGVFDATGTLLASAEAAIAMHRAAGGIAEQSGDEVWQAVCNVVRRARAEAGVAAAQVAGLGFDATCSMVVRDAAGAPLPVGDPEQPASAGAPEYGARDIIVWMDHRAVEQARRINAGAHEVLRYVGGRISPEMQSPKLMWLREMRPEIYARAAHFFDLTDFLGWKATGSLQRSTCTVTCKWTYLPHAGGWQADYFRAIGLGDLADQGFARIGADVVAPGVALGTGLSAEAAAALDLRAGTAVGAGLIDAHAGGIGTVGARAAGAPQEVSHDRPDQAYDQICARMAYVFGTSSCTMTTTRDAAFVPGVWGPYRDAMVPGAWLNEGGQSAAGAAMDRLVALHPASAQAREIATAEGKPLHGWLADRALAEAGTASAAIDLAQGLHVVPEFLGNRAPHADPEARAIISGLGMEADLDSLVALYVAGIAGLGYGLRQIIETQAAHGAPIRTVMLSGGAGRHPLIRQLLADASGVAVETTRCSEPVLLGAAMLGAVACGGFPALSDAMEAMSQADLRFEPVTGDRAAVHAARHDAFCRLQDLQRSLRKAETAEDNH